MLPETFFAMKPIIAMAHLGPLPGAPGYDAAGGIDALTEAVAADLEKLQEGGVDAVMFGNEGDRPYVLKATPESLTAMSVIVARLAPTLRIPFGVNYLWDSYATVALAVATGAAFAREIFTGVYASDMGMWQPDCAGALRLRASLGRPDLKLLFNINAEFAASLDDRPIERRAASAVFSSLADVICVSGPMTGEATEKSDLKKVKAVVTDCPVLANTGVTIDNVEAILPIADGCVIGTHFKQGGDTHRHRHDVDDRYLNRWRRTHRGTRAAVGRPPFGTARLG
jgi:membrane complex biogenesis BtpA family protein